jgi:cobalt-zinc-cadmium efflux system protein
LAISTTKKLLISVSILSITFAGELIGGIVFGSLSLVSDSFHVFSDIFALLIAYTALRIAHAKAPNDRMTYGYHRLEVFSAIINGATLVAMSVYIMREAYDRYLHPREVQAFSVMLVAVLGLVVNISTALVLRKNTSHKKDINLRSAYLHLLGDSAASFAVIMGMLAISLTGTFVIDAIVAGLISILIIISAIRVLVEGAGILAQRSPTDLERIRSRVRQINGVIDIDDLRMWQVCSHLAVGTAHVITNVKRIEETAPLKLAIEKVLADECDIRHLTLHFETPEMSQTHTHKFNHQHADEIPN